MIDFLLLNYLVEKKTSSLLPTYLQLKHGGHPFLKKQQQNFLKTMMEPLLETLLMLIEF